MNPFEITTTLVLFYVFLKAKQQKVLQSIEAKKKKSINATTNQPIKKQSVIYFKKKIILFCTVYYVV